MHKKQLGNWKEDARLQKTQSINKYCFAKMNLHGTLGYKNHMTMSGMCAREQPAYS